jgi:hypothetical protein
MNTGLSVQSAVPYIESIQNGGRASRDKPRNLLLFGSLTIFGDRVRPGLYHADNENGKQEGHALETRGLNILAEFEPIAA